MKKNTRKEERFSEIGRVDSPLLSSLPGVLDDISLTGCKVHYSIPLNVDMDQEYKLLLRIVKQTTIQLEMICRPQWVNAEDNRTEIGFSFMRSPDSPELSNFINGLKVESTESDIKNLIVDEDVVFIS